MSLVDKDQEPVCFRHAVLRVILRNEAVKEVSYKAGRCIDCLRDEVQEQYRQVSRILEAQQ